MQVMPKKSKRLKDTGELIFYICLIALPLLQVAIFYVYVNFNSVLLSFQKYEKLNDAFVFDPTFANFKRLWMELTETTILWDALKNSFAIWIYTSIFGKFLALMFSYYIYKKWFASKIFKFFLFLPSVLPSILLVIMFKFFANEAIPGYAGELLNVTISPLLVGKDTLLPTVFFFNIWASFGGQILIYTGTMDQISPEIIEAGQVDGVKPMQEFFYIVIPIILPTITTFLIASVAGLFTNQAALYSFFGDSSNVTFENFTVGYYLFDLVNKSGVGKSNYGYASILGLVCTFIAFPLMVLLRKVLTKAEA